jgi:hypothetical protein
MTEKDELWTILSLPSRRGGGVTVGIDSLVESGVLPILLKYRGQPIVTEDGYILYHFPVRFNCI